MIYLKELKIELVETKMKNPVRGQVEKPADIHQAFRHLENSDKEKVIGVYLNARFIINSFEVLSIGPPEFAFLAPKEIFKGALLTNSRYVILVHNHPSGDPTPSAGDKNIIRKVLRQAEIMEIEMFDFIIVDRDRFWSWRTEGRNQYT